MSEADADQLVRWTARLVVGLYLLRCAGDAWTSRSEIGLSLRDETGRQAWRDLARFLWCTACGVFVLHVIAALVFVHHLSHAAAYEQTARRTAEVVGLNWGGGIYVNHAFLLFWLYDAQGWFRHGHQWAYGSSAWYWSVQGIFAFMFINATLIFGPPHWWWVLGLCLLSVGFAWWRGSLRSQATTANEVD